VNYEAVNYVDYANYEADSGKTNMENVCLTKDISLVSNIIGLTGKAEGCRNGDQHRFVTCVAWEGLYVFFRYWNSIYWNVDCFAIYEDVVVVFSGIIWHGVSRLVH